MKIAALSSKLPGGGERVVMMRGTDAQDVPVAPGAAQRKRRILIAAGAAGSLLLVLVFVWLVGAWTSSANTVPRERLRVATVESGRFVRDVAAQGTVVAAVNPTMFAAAPGTIDYRIRAGDTVKKVQVLAVLDSPQLRNEHERERATLESLDAALARQTIEIRRQLLKSRQEADLAKVQITAADRELKRAQSSWNLRVISERDFQRARDELETAKLNFEHARDTAELERDSLNLDLRTRRFERDRRALVVANLKRRVDDLAVRSPVDGMVANLAQQQRASVAENAPLLTVVDLSAFEVEFQVAETYARDIRPGMSAEIMLDGRRHTGTVTAISPEVRQSQVTGRLKFAGAQPERLRQNQRTSIRIVLDERDGVLRFERGAQIDELARFVYVVREDLAVRTPVELGAASVAQIEVIRGLAAGDRVIVSDTRDFSDAPEILITD
jgi:HlyD family secretion protein